MKPTVSVWASANGCENQVRVYWCGMFATPGNVFTTLAQSLVVNARVVDADDADDALVLCKSIHVGLLVACATESAAELVRKYDWQKGVRQEAHADHVDHHDVAISRQYDGAPKLAVMSDEIILHM